MSNYKVGDIIRCKISGIEDYGAFITAEDNYSGLIHISEISTNFVKKISDYVELGEEIYAEIIDVSNDDKKLKLSIKNIDYRNTGKPKEGNGFKILKDNLPKWMEEYHEKNK